MVNCIYKYKGKDYTKEEFYSLVRNTMVQPRTVQKYEKVLFPSGNTASKIEGHTTLEEFKKQKEDRIKELEKDIYDYTYNNYRVYRKSDNISLGNTASKEDTELFFNSNNLIQKNPSDFEIRRNDESYIIKQKNNEIAQLKKELERVETEGFGALKPIYNFYENTVTNILKKSYNINQITDEYGNTWNEIVLDNENTDKIFFQTDTKVKNILTELDKRDKEVRTIEKDDKSIKEVLKDGVWKYIKRVSELVKGFQSKSGNTAASEFGTKIHNDINYYFKEALGEDVSKLKLEFSSGVVTRQIKDFIIQVLDEFPVSDFDYKTEVNIHDNKVAGTIDLLIVNKSTGEAHLIDYKNVVNLETKGLSKSKKDEWQQQLTEYEKILKSYGITKIGISRMIPINIDYNSKVQGTFDLTTFKMSRFNNVMKDTNLNAVPSLNERYKTDDRIDTLLSKLEDRYNRLIKTGKTLEAKNIKEQFEHTQISNELEYIKAQSVTDEHDFKRLIDNYDKGVELSEEDIYNLVMIRDYYKNRILDRLVGDAQNSEESVINELASTTIAVQRLSYKVDEIVIDNNSKKGFENRINKPFNSFDKLFNLSQRDNPAFQSFYRLMRTVQAKKEEKVKEIQDRVKGYIERLKTESGKSDESMFYPIYQRDNKGRLLPKLISSKNQKWFDFFTQHEKSMYDSKDLTLTRFKASPISKYVNMSLFEPMFNEEMEKTRIRFEGREDDVQFKEGLKTKRYLLSKIKAYSDFIDIENPNFEQFLTDEYKKLVSSKSVLLDLYKEMIALNKYANKHADAGITNNMLPYVRKGLVQNFVNNPLKTVNTIKDSFNINTWETFEIDSKGEKIYKIPLKYNTDINKRDLTVQSYDLGELMLNWADAVYNNDLLNKSHDASLLFKEQLVNSKQFVLENGEYKQQNGRFVEIPVEAATVEEYTDYHNSYFYNLQDKSGNFEVPLLGKNGKKIVKSTIQYFSAVNVGGNIFSGLSNITGGGVNAYSYTGKHYKKKDLIETSLTLFSDKNKALGYLFDIDTNIYDKDRYKDISVSKINSFFTLDKIYLLQKGGDWFMSNSILGAMSKNYTIKNKKIVLKEDDDVSLFDMLEQKGDKYVLPELEEGEVFKFRERAKSVTAGIIGNSSEFDRALANNTFLGQIALQYRRWMLPLGVSRFGNLKYNSSLEEFQIGKYKSFTQLLFSDFKNKKLKDLATFIYHGKGGTIHSYLQNKYQKELLINPNIANFDGIIDELRGYDEFVKIYRQGLISTIMEAVLILSLIGLKAGLDDDDDKTPLQKTVLRMTGRTIKESTFWIIPKNFQDVINKPFPIIQSLSSVIDLFTLPLFNMFDDDKTVFEGVGDKAKKNIIGVGAYYKFIDEINKD